LLRRLAAYKVFRNFSYLTVGSGISQLIGVFTVIRITSLFSPEKYGIYTFIISQGTLLFTIGDLGITNVVIRTIARNSSRTGDIIFNGALIRFFSVSLLILLYATYNYFFGNLSSIQVVFVYLFALVSCFAHLFEIAFTGNQKMLPVSVINISYSLVWFLTVITIPGKYFTVSFLFTAFLVLNTLKATAAFIVLKTKRMLTGAVNILRVSSKALLKESRPYFFLMLVMLPATYLSNNFLQLNSTNTEIGYFNLSQKLTAPIDLVLGFALSALFPNLSALWIDNEPRFKQLVAAWFKYFMLAGMLLCFVFTLFARELISFIFKADYLPAAPVCQLQVWYVFLIGVSSLTGIILGAVNKEKLVLRSGIVSALLATPILYTGSRYGALGLSYGYVIAFAVSMAYVWHLFKKGVAVSIKNDVLLWLLALASFLLSYFVLQNMDIPLKIASAVVVAAVVSVYFVKSGKTILAR